MRLASRSTLNHSNRSNEHQEKPLSNSAQESSCRNFSVIFWDFGEFRISPPIQKFCGQIRKKWLNRKLGKVLKQQIQGSNPRKTQRIDRSVKIPFGFSKLARTRKFEGVKGVDWGVKSVATKLLIPYDEEKPLGLARSSRIDRGKGGKNDEHEEHKGDN